MGEIPLDAISAEACATFCRSTGAPTRFWENKHQTLRGFNYLVSRGIFSPPRCKSLAHAPHAFQPYIYSHEELQRLLQATVTLTSTRFLAATRRIARCSSSCTERGSVPAKGSGCGAVMSISANACSIWDTKFFKSRVVPIGEDLGRALGTYRQARESLPKPAGSRAPLFLLREVATPSPASSLKKSFGVCGSMPALGDRRRIGGNPASMTSGTPWPSTGSSPGTARVSMWKRDSPLLAAYLGHVNVSGTQIYPTMTPELLAEASWRFERYAAVGKEHTHG